MDTHAFEAALRAEGFTEIETKTYGSRPANEQHGHHFSVRGLVLEGAFTVIRGEDHATYRPGEVFAVPAGCLHCEEIGPAGARVLVGRKY